MCEEAKRLMTGYMDTLEEYDRLHLMFLGASRAKDEAAMDAYRDLLRATSLRTSTARAKFQDHQKTHGCAEAIRMDGAIVPPCFDR